LSSSELALPQTCTHASQDSWGTPCQVLTKIGSLGLLMQTNKETTAPSTTYGKLFKNLAGMGNKVLLFFVYLDSSMTP
jgi:hypothetical protein